MCDSAQMVLVMCIQNDLHYYGPITWIWPVVMFLGHRRRDEWEGK